MRTIRLSKRFKKDYKREARGKHGARLDEFLAAVISLLRADQPLPPNYRDHPLTGTLSDHRDCHIKPDLVLIYRKPDDEHLDLARLGSHSELGL